MVCFVFIIHYVAFSRNTSRRHNATAKKIQKLHSTEKVLSSSLFFSGNIPLYGDDEKGFTTTMIFSHTATCSCVTQATIRAVELQLLLLSKPAYILARFPVLNGNDGREGGDQQQSHPFCSGYSSSSPTQPSLCFYLFPTPPPLFSSYYLLRGYGGREWRCVKTTEKLKIKVIM